MRNLGALWEKCHNGTIEKGEWEYGRRLTIAGVQYHNEDILKLEHFKGLIEDTISIGNTVSAQLNAKVVAPQAHTVNKGSLVKFELRVETLNDGVSPWQEFGYFYVDRIEMEKGEYSIVAYDKIASLEIKFPKGNYDCNSALSLILNRMNVQLDSRTNISRNVSLPGAEEYTFRQVLGYIGSLNLGNWHLTESNKLRLVRFNNNNPVHSIEEGNSKKIKKMTPMSFDKVVLTNNNLEEVIEAGSGDFEFHVENPWGDSNLGNSILNNIAPYEFYPTNVQSNEINPAVELGDVIEIEGNPVNFVNVNYSTGMYADIIVPDEGEKYRHSYYVGGWNGGGGGSGGGGGDYDSLKNDLDFIKELLGLDQCYIIQNSDTTENNGNLQYFHDNHQLHCVIIPKQFTQLEIRGGDESYTLDVKGGTGLIDASSMFEGSNIGVFDINELNTSKVQSMYQMFRNISEYYDGEIIGIENLNTSNVTNMMAMFSFNEKIVDFKPNYNVRKVESMYRMFSRCSNTRNIDLSKFSTPKLTDCGYMFWENYNLESVDISNFKTLNLESVNSMFRDCNNLKKVSLPKKFTVNDGTDLAYMFEGCFYLEEIDTSRFITEYPVRFRIDHMFRDCRNLKKVDLSNMTLECELLSLSAGNFDGLFEDCVSLKSVSIPAISAYGETPLYERAISIDRMFKNTPSLETSVIDFRELILTSFKDAFLNTTLDSIIINQHTDTSVGDDLRQEALKSGVNVVVVENPWRE